MKFIRRFDSYYSEDGLFLIQRGIFGGWCLWCKAFPDAALYTVHVVDCDTLLECKRYAKDHRDALEVLYGSKART